MTKAKNPRRHTKRFWTAGENATLREMYPGNRSEEIAALLGRTIGQVYQHAAHLGLKKSAEYLVSPAACRLRGNNPNSVATRFQKGQAPHNKGLRRPGWGPGRMKETQFKPGVRQGVAARNWCPIGTIKTDTEGFLRIKIREGKKGEAYGFGNTKIWPLLNRHVWEQHNGPISPGHIVIFKDKDRSNTDIANLELITLAENMRRNTVHNLPKELALTIQLAGALKRKIRNLSEKQNDRSA